MLRINSDGSIPADNPTTFPGIAGSPSGNNRAIWSVDYLVRGGGGGVFKIIYS